MKALMKKLILTAQAFMAGALSVTYAINPVRIDTVRTQLVVPRPALEPLKSLVTSPTDAIDTLDTANEHIKVVLHADNTWHYYKTPSFQQVSGVYDSNWDDNSTNPYGIEQKDLPDEWAIWLVDSLDQYHCPFKGTIHPRGKFGPRRGRRHQGVDIPLKTGEPVYAVADGTVTDVVRSRKGLGNVVTVDHGGGYYPRYAHLADIEVRKGRNVKKGTRLGYVGMSGNSFAPHLHYEVLKDTLVMDPVHYFFASVSPEEYVNMLIMSASTGQSMD